MKFSLASALALPLIVSAADILVTVVTNDIGAIDTAVRQLNSSVTAYNGTTAGATPILVGVANIHLVNRKAFVDAAAPINASSADSEVIVTFTEDTVGQSIPSTTDNTISKKPQFQAAGLDSQIQSGLKLLKNDHDTYSAELLAKVSPDWLARAQAVVKKIDDAIQKGIDAFAN